MQPTRDIHMQTVTATSAGPPAVEALSAASRATIAGRTSRGIFVRLDVPRVIFLTREQFRSPLTVTLPQNVDELEAIAAEDAVLVRAGRISFPDTGIQVHIPAGVTWTCPTPPGTAVPVPEQYRRLKRLVSAIVVTAPERGWSSLLPALVDSSYAYTIPRSLQPTWESVRELRAALAAGDAETMVATATRLLGRGRGLTPSGDDLVLGLTLMLNRWPERVTASRILDRYNAGIVDAAYTHTTTLSAGLVESATLGVSDERLVQTADNLATDALSLASTVADVLRWGNSSGIDALVGMSVAVTAQMHTLRSSEEADSASTSNAFHNTSAVF